MRCQAAAAAATGGRRKRVKGAGLQVNGAIVGGGILGMGGCGGQQEQHECHGESKHALGHGVISYVSFRYALPPVDWWSAGDQQRTCSIQ